VRLEFEKSNDLIGNQTHDLPACSIVPQPTTLPRAQRNVTRTITFEEERGRRVYVKRILGKVIGRKKEEIEIWMKVCNSFMICALPEMLLRLSN
jgi:hypothetical protein